MKNILFVCIENSNRSQMAEAFGHIYEKEGVRVFSAGSRPSGKINPKAVEAMKELGYDLTSHASISVDDFANMDFEYVISMGCGDDCPHLPARFREDWLIPDPKDLSPKEYAIIRDYIGIKVKQLISSL